MEAGVIVAALEENGIKATLTGETTAGFRAEAPGWVQVLVAEEDLPRAHVILDEARQQRGNDVDWSTVDVGEPEEEVIHGSASRWMGLSLWRRIVYIFVVVWLLWFFVNLGDLVVSLLLRAIGIGA
jgi:hypothetical protein